MFLGQWWARNIPHAFSCDFSRAQSHQAVRVERGGRLRSLMSHRWATSYMGRKCPTSKADLIIFFHKCIKSAQLSKVSLKYKTCAAGHLARHLQFWGWFSQEQLSELNLIETSNKSLFYPKGFVWMFVQIPSLVFTIGTSIVSLWMPHRDDLFVRRTIM